MGGLRGARCCWPQGRALQAVGADSCPRSPLLLVPPWPTGLPTLPLCTFWAHRPACFPLVPAGWAAVCPSTTPYYTAAPSPARRPPSAALTQNPSWAPRTTLPASSPKPTLSSKRIQALRRAFLPGSWRFPHLPNSSSAGFPTDTTSPRAPEPAEDGHASTTQRQRWTTGASMAFIYTTHTYYVFVFDSWWVLSSLILRVVLNAVIHVFVFQYPGDKTYMYAYKAADVR